VKGKAVLIMEVIYKCESKEERRECFVSRVQTKEEVNRGILIGYVNIEAMLLRELTHSQITVDNQKKARSNWKVRRF
jgi:hypothetical protein